jgi:hypothetical protein
MMKKAISLLVAVGLALAGVPAIAQSPNTVSGTVPQGVEGTTNAILVDASGKTIATVPVAAGTFAFRDVAPGDYFVDLLNAAGQQLIRSCSLNLASGAERVTSFACTPPVVLAAGGGGISTTAWILIGAAAVGITTAVVIATNDDEGPASPIR